MNYDGAGNLYFASVGECRIRKVDTGGTITTVAGNGTCGYNSDGIAATSAELNLARGVVLDSSGNLYIADTANHVVRKVNTSGVISTFAGTVGKGGFSGDGGPATSARIGSPRALTIFNGSLYIANGGNGRIRVVNLGTNIINTYAGSTIGYDGDGHALLSSQFNGTGPVTFDASGNSYIPDTYNGRLRKASGGIVTTFAGGYLGDGGKATAAALVLPEALAIDKSGNFYIADYTGNRVRKVSAGIITTLAGSGVSGYFGDNGPATSALLNEPQGVAVDSLGNVFIADTLNNVIRKVTPAGTISTFATNPNFGYLLQMATDASNNLYVADAGSCVVWKITPIGVAAVAAGAVGFCDYNGDGIPSTTAHLNQPYGVAIDSGGNLLIADWANNRVREVNTVGTIGTIAGNGFCGWTGDGGSATTAEVCPNSVAVDKSGNIYVADFTFGRIRKISNGNITTFAGAGFGFNGDGLWPLYTTLDDPVQVAVTAAGTVYELDDVDHRVRSIK